MTSSERNRRIVDTIGLLRVSGIGRGRFLKLTGAFGSPAAVHQASITALTGVPGISRTLATAIKEEYDENAAREIADRIQQLDWTVLFPGDDAYPSALAEIPVPPPILFSVGRPAAREDRLIGIVGTRHPSEHGKRFAYSLSRRLAEAGVIVVSGMAEGIDAAAHQGALDGGGTTVAVWGSSLDVVYPPGNRQLAERIRTDGSVYAEYFPGTSPDRPHFPERNRIISGMSTGIVVIEAGQRSGALITAEHAFRQGRAVFAVPGAPGEAMSIGSNALIKGGGTLITSADDIFEELPALKGAVAARRFARLPDLTGDEKRLIALFADGPQQLDQLSRTAGMPVHELSQYLLALELKGVVQELSGKRFTLAEEYVC